MICKENGCGKKVRGLGWCGMHYMRWYRYGDPEYTKTEMHGYRYHPLYKVWADMEQRCYNKNCWAYKWYGGRGIEVCDEWKNSSRTFIEWALPLWKEGLEIDRRDNDGDYCPENCRFVTSKENAHNRKMQSNNTSGYRGVSKRNKKWVAKIMIDNKNKHLGYFDSPRIAALRYDVEAYLIDNRPRNFS